VPDVAVIIPIKGFGAAKARLDGALDPAARADLARSMAATVIGAAAPLPVIVVTDDAGVADFAARAGADVLRQRRDGLNAPVDEGVAHPAALGFARALIAHGDLPRASNLARVSERHGVVVVPDRHGDGTNVLVVPTGVGFEFAYGPASFAAHLAEAERLGLAVAVLHDADLAWDVDTPADLDDSFRDPRSA
jgi:2-phospho-L-lactate/phosphoenolpyruvate guanylyltransferase